MVPEILVVVVVSFSVTSQNPNLLAKCRCQGQHVNIQRTVQSWRPEIFLKIEYGFVAGLRHEYDFIFEVRVVIEKQGAE